MTASPRGWEDEDVDPSVVGLYLFGSGSKGSLDSMIKLFSRSRVFR